MRKEQNNSIGSNLHNIEVLKLSPDDLHIREVAGRFVLQHPQQSTRPLYGLIRQFFTDIYSLLKTEVAVNQCECHTLDVADMLKPVFSDVCPHLWVDFSQNIV